jgi:hypothetical protein
VKPSRLLLSVSAALVLAATTTACGGDDKPAAESTPTAAVSSAAPAAFTGSVSTTAFIDNLLAAIDSQTSVHLKVDAGDAGVGDADVSYGTPGDTKIRVVGSYSTNNATMLVIYHRVVYVQQDVGGRYIAIDKNDPSYGQLLATFSDIGPHESVAGLAPGISEVVRDGTETVDGRQLLRYDVTVDPSKATGAFKAMAGTSGISQAVKFEFYTDSDNLLRRVEATITGQKTVVDLVDWDKPVSIKVPSGAEVMSPSDVSGP